MNTSKPLAHILRPSSLVDFKGQHKLVKEGGPLFRIINEGILMSFVLWGPPGTGKTTLAKIYGNSIDAELFELSAVSAGKDDVRKVIQAAQSLGGFGKPTILFLDEIHRFNKAQQDFLLPYVENGTIILIGATTENPSFEIIPALLSRLNVFMLESLPDAEMGEIIKKGFEQNKVKISKPGIERIIELSRGDARRALGLVETIVNLYSSEKKLISRAKIDLMIEKTPLRYSKKGDEHYDVISAFIKSMRGSDGDASLYYLARMIESGEDPKFIARRMVIFASEDIGNALPTALVVANEVFKAVEVIGMPEAAINLAHGTLYLAQAPKDKSAYLALMSVMEDVKKYGELPIPQSLLNAPTKLMKEMGNGKGYSAYGTIQRLPDTLKQRSYVADARTMVKKMKKNK